MKKYLNYALVGAIALTGAVGITSCTSDSEVIVEDNPGFNSGTGEVPVNFVMSISSGNTGSSTRMNAVNTQATLDQPFRGIEKATLMSFSQKNGGSLTDGLHISAATTANKSYDLGTILNSGDLDPDGTGSTPKSRRVVELTLPTETNTLMFWGKGIKEGTNADNAQGNIDWNVGKDLSTTAFTLKKRIPDGTGAGTAEAFGQYEALLAAVLTNIVQTANDYDVSYGGTSYTGTINWSDYVSIAGTGASATLVVKTKDPADGTGNTDMTPLGEILAKTFVEMNTIHTNEVRAGSGPTLARLLGDLYATILPVSTANPTNQYEAIAKSLAQQIITNINYVISSPGSAPVWNSTLSNIKTFSGLATTATNLVTGDLNGFPRAIFGVPNGTTTLKYDVENRQYSYNETIPTYAMDGTAGGSFNVLNYRYPAELCYFGNSPIRETSEAHETSHYPDGVANWDADASWAANAMGSGSLAWNKNSHVQSTTRSVAMQENINYGTSLLRMTVKYGATTLKDNNKAIQQARKGATEDDKTITVAAGTFTLTGILIGGVEETVGWNYLAKAASPSFSSFIYDSAIPSGAIPSDGTASAPNYTLVWDNWNPQSAGSKQNVVNVALEFVNNSGKDFWGMNNLIRNGATFYIAGKMDPDAISVTGKTAEQITADKSLGIVWPGTEEGQSGSPYALPPYDSNGNTIKQRRVFIQDYMTEANFVIGENSLKGALVSVPDLRSTQISLGLSVDLSWSTGLKFNDVILGQ